MSTSGELTIGTRSVETTNGEINVLIQNANDHPVEIPALGANAFTLEVTGMSSCIDEGGAISSWNQKNTTIEKGESRQLFLNVEECGGDWREMAGGIYEVEVLFYNKSIGRFVLNYNSPKRAVALIPWLGKYVEKDEEPYCSDETCYRAMLGKCHIAGGKISQMKICSWLKMRSSGDQYNDSSCGLERSPSVVIDSGDKKTSSILLLACRIEKEFLYASQNCLSPTIVDGSYEKVLFSVLLQARDAGISAEDANDIWTVLQFATLYGCGKKHSALSDSIISNRKIASEAAGLVLRERPVHLKKSSAIFDDLLKLRRGEDEWSIGKEDSDITLDARLKIADTTDGLYPMGLSLRLMPRSDSSERLP